MFVFGIAGWKGGAPAAWAEESRWADGNIPPSWSELSKPTWFCDICNKVFSNGGAWYNHKKEKTKTIFFNCFELHFVFIGQRNINIEIKFSKRV